MERGEWNAPLEPPLAGRDPGWEQVGIIGVFRNGPLPRRHENLVTLDPKLSEVERRLKRTDVLLKVLTGPESRWRSRNIKFKSRSLMRLLLQELLLKPLFWIRKSHLHHFNTNVNHTASISGMMILLHCFWFQNKSPLLSCSGQWLSLH